MVGNVAQVKKTDGIAHQNGVKKNGCALKNSATFLKWLEIMKGKIDSPEGTKTIDEISDYLYDKQKTGSREQYMENVKFLTGITIDVFERYKGKIN